MRIAGMVLALIVAFGGGIAVQIFLLKDYAIFQTGGAPAATEMATNEEQEPLYWVAPMDKNYRRDKPGQS
ncbi:MAG: hypothetical protein MI864_10685, partial [Pseudomonadales bacterium]|nr:hypothetical protein [Pseudomonadales bacterium]